MVRKTQKDSGQIILSDYFTAPQFKRMKNYRFQINSALKPVFPTIIQEMAATPINVSGYKGNGPEIYNLG